MRRMPSRSDDGDARIAADEVQCAMVRPAEAELLEDHVRGVGEIAVGEEQQVLRQPHLGLPQEQQVGTGRTVPGRVRRAARAGDGCSSPFGSGMAGIPREAGDLRQLC